MKKNNPLTLAQISKLLDKKFEEKLAPIKSDVSSLKSDVNLLKTDVSTIKVDLKSLRTVVDEGFDRIGDQLQIIIQISDDIASQKALEVKSELEPRIKKLEHKVFAS